jgi:hypothetical protein
MIKLTGLQKEIKDKKIKIRKLAPILNKSFYYMGQKIKHNNFTVDEAKTLMAFFGKGFNELFYEVERKGE